MVEVMGIEPMSQRVYHPVYFYSLACYEVSGKPNEKDTSVIDEIRYDSGLSALK